VRISVTVKSQARQEKVEKISDGSYLVWTKSPPRDGRANESIRKILGGAFGVPKSKVAIVRGIGSKKKTVDIISK